MPVVSYSVGRVLRMNLFPIAAFSQMFGSRKMRYASGSKNERTAWDRRADAAVQNEEVWIERCDLRLP